mmetsp:Transcript_4732/g.6231  ORF Transcript_4732/g.6231 Transcript_4732/m.6231 type:complete len:123 (-) Transcript_4732:541-909(-)
MGKQIENVAVNKKDIKWESEDLSYLEESTFRRNYWEIITAAKVAKDTKNAMNLIGSSNVILTYNDLKDFVWKAKYFGIMHDERAGVPRTAYKGVVEVKVKGKNSLFLAPPRDKLEQDFSIST